MKKLVLIVIICMSFVILSSTDTIDNKEVTTKDCVCAMVVECYYPGYQSGVDLPFASKIVYSCDEAEKYMQHISQTVEYPDGIDIPNKYSAPVFFFLYPAES